MKIVQSPEDMVAYWAVRTIAGLSQIRSMLRGTSQYWILHDLALQPCFNRRNFVNFKSKNLLCFVGFMQVCKIVEKLIIHSILFARDLIQCHARTQLAGCHKPS